jgi:hypothetical protein
MQNRILDGTVCVVEEWKLNDQVLGFDVAHI